MPMSSCPAHRSKHDFIARIGLVRLPHDGLRVPLILPMIRNSTNWSGNKPSPSAVQLSLVASPEVFFLMVIFQSGLAS